MKSNVYADLNNIKFQFL